MTMWFFTGVGANIMFTGIIQQLAQVISLDKKEEGRRLVLSHQFERLTLGESIAVNGVCLTVVEASDAFASFDISPESLLKTNLGKLQPSREVNLERAMLATDRFGGHMVTGHVSQCLPIQSKKKHGDYTEFVIGGLTPETISFVVPKGCIALDGISLTVNDVFLDSFSVMIIPHTLNHTTLKMKRDNETLNVEYDYFARIIIEHMKKTR